ncbi:MAG: FAD-binding oxidoreductase [Chloroflexi bacterium]|nr:FAD-binding oxidoreductase [Chloroflexota bacterium]
MPARPAVRYVDRLPGTVDMVIIGGGVVGAATAFFATRAGLRVAVLEARPRLATLTTAASTGAFRLQFDNPEEIALVREGIELFSEFGVRTGLEEWDLGLTLGGYLFGALTDQAAERARRLVQRQWAWGVTDVELLDGDEARHRFPYLSVEVRGARFRAGDGWLDPRRLALGYVAAASNPARIPNARAGGGAVVATSCRVTALAIDARGRVDGVVTDRGAVSAESVVIAAGPLSGEVSALGGLSIDLRPTTRQKLVFPDLPEVPADAPMTIEEETAAHWRPNGGGCFALWTDPGAQSSEATNDPVPDQTWAFGLLDPSSDHALARLSPFWKDVWARGTDNWYLQAGQYEYTPDRRPFLGPTRIPGLALNAGYSGHGVMASAAGSRIVVDLLTGAMPPEANAFHVDRAPVAREHDIL